MGHTVRLIRVKILVSAHSVEKVDFGHEELVGILVWHDVVVILVGKPG